MVCGDVGGWGGEEMSDVILGIFKKIYKYLSLGS